MQMNRHLADSFFPGYFALVMATGIVAIACYLCDMAGIAWILFWLNTLFYLCLVLLLILHLSSLGLRSGAVLVDPARGPGFLTLVASTSVLGTQFITLAHNYIIAELLWIVALVLWLLLIYAFFFGMIVRPVKPELDRGLNGGWLLAVVATQSISTLGSMIAGMLLLDPAPLLFAMMAVFLLGGMLYIIIIAICFYRMVFLPLDPRLLTPNYWITMGAAAITTLAGANLLLHGQESDALVDMLPFLKGLTVFFWSAGTWWIPLLIALGIWRHAVRHVPLVYDPQYWSLVFPLGMYTTCTIELANATGFAFMLAIPRVFVFIALIAWAITCCAMFYHLLTASLHLRQSPQLEHHK